MAKRARAPLDEASLTLAPRGSSRAGMNLQAPPNLSPARWPVVDRSGINDWGASPPVTPIT